jgi:hypothetical protein
MKARTRPVMDSHKQATMDTALVPAHLRTKLLSTDVSKLCGLREQTAKNESVRKDQIQLQKESQDTAYPVNRIFIEVVGIQLKPPSSLPNKAAINGSSTAEKVSRIVFSSELMGVRSQDLVAVLDLEQASDAMGHKSEGSSSAPRTGMVATLVDKER